MKKVSITLYSGRRNHKHDLASLITFFVVLGLFSNSWQTQEEDVITGLYWTTPRNWMIQLKIQNAKWVRIEKSNVTVKAVIKKTEGRQRGGGTCTPLRLSVSDLTRWYTAQVKHFVPYHLSHSLPAAQFPKRKQTWPFISEQYTSSSASLHLSSSISHELSIHLICSFQFRCPLIVRVKCGRQYALCRSKSL